MAGVENQYHLGQDSPDFVNPSESIDSVTRAAFQKVQKLWFRYAPLIPQDYDLKTGKGCDINFPGGNIYLSERTMSVSHSPRIEDVSSSWEDWVAPETKVVIMWYLKVKQLNCCRLGVLSLKPGSNGVQCRQPRTIRRMASHKPKPKVSEGCTDWYLR